jgi:hypothetical protein
MKAQEILDRIGSLDTDISLAAESFQREAAALLASGQGRKLPHYDTLYKYGTGERLPITVKSKKISNVYQFVMDFNNYYYAYLAKRAELVEMLKGEVAYPYPYRNVQGKIGTRRVARDQEKSDLKKQVARLKRELAQLKEK